MRTTQIAIVALLFAAQMMAQQKEKRGHENGDSDKRLESVFNTVIPALNYNIILGRPTQNSITLSLLSSFRGNVKVEYWIAGEQNRQSITSTFEANVPKELLLSGLKSNNSYRYQLRIKKEGDKEFSSSEIFHFQTPRPKSASFAFTITADSHLDENADVAVYRQTLLNAKSDSADFHIDLGDTFMTDKYRQNYKDAFSQYLAQRYYFGLLCSSSPLFFVQGNHDGESGQRLNGKEDNMTVWATTMRKKYFPNPSPNLFYSGNSTDEPFVGQPQNYYAWEWGNALFVVLDPFRYTPRSGMENPWDRTLGKAQYDWLNKTLQTSSAKFKFIFIHNLVGGVDLKGKARGGVEVSQLYEWGGFDADGKYEFTTKRTGWEAPIHQLLVKYKVTAVFHGHDHIFAHQQRDGVIYQCLSQPGAMEFGNTRNGEEYGYLSGKIMNLPSYMRVEVSPKTAKFSLVETGQSTTTKSVVYQYEIK